MVTYDRSFIDAVPHIHPVYQDMMVYEDDYSANYKAQLWTNSNATYPVLNLLGGTAEVCNTADSTQQMVILGGDYYLGAVDPNRIQANTLFYKRMADSQKGYSFVGFRIVVTTQRKR